MTEYGIQSYKIRVNEGLVIVESLLKESGTKTATLAKVLPLMATPSDARLLVQKVLHGDKIEIHRLRREIGYALRPILGICDGYYVLDLSVKLDQLCLNRLLEVAMTVAYERGECFDAHD